MVLILFYSTVPLGRYRNSKFGRTCQNDNCRLLFLLVPCRYIYSTYNKDRSRIKSDYHIGRFTRLTPTEGKNTSTSSDRGTN